jgi:hypothetical protein
MKKQTICDICINGYSFGVNHEYVKAQPIRLRDAEKDEKWLQELLLKDSSLLNLGELEVIRRERSQTSGGRLDLLLSDSEANILYEVEIMLGKTDPSHIIRTIEYWDNERRRSPNFEHVAVIVAEEITNRFFNVIGLLNKAVPIIAIQLHAFIVGDKLCVTFVRVLDQTEDQKDDEEGGDAVDRKYWEARASKKSLELMDAIISLVPKEAGEVRIKYNRGHVALGTSGTNFCWFHPRRGAQIHIHAKPGEEARKALIPKLQEKGVESSARRSDQMSASLTEKDFEESKEILKELILACEQNSQK